MEFWWLNWFVRGFGFDCEIIEGIVVVIIVFISIFSSYFFFSFMGKEGFFCCDVFCCIVVWGGVLIRWGVFLYIF